MRRILHSSHRLVFPPFISTNVPKITLHSTCKNNLKSKIPHNFTQPLCNNNISRNITTLNKNNVYYKHVIVRSAHVHIFRAAHYVAPILFRNIRNWIGTPKTNKHFFRNLAVLIAILIPYPIYHYYSNLQTVPYTNRVRYVSQSAGEEQRISELVYSDLFEKLQPNFIPADHHIVSHVTGVANRITAVCGRDDINWEVHVVDYPVPNAFVLPGGKIFVFRGILDITQNDDALAFILGHEVAHVLARHSAEQLGVENIMLAISITLSGLIGDTILSHLVGKVVSVLTELKYSRKLESEADYIGLQLMHKAHFEVAEAPRVWERMIRLVGDAEVGDFLSSHPSHAERKQDLIMWIADLKAEDKATNKTK